MEVFVILVTTFIATVLSAMSGGGSSVITLPVFLAIGLPFPTAMSVIKLSAIFWVAPTAFTYLKGKRIEWKFLILFSVIGLIGSFLGVQAAIVIKQRYLEIAIGALIILLVIYTYFHKGLGVREHIKEYSPMRKALAYPFAIVLGFYESIFGSGNGILFAMVTFFTRGFDFIDALGHYFAIGFLWVAFAAFLFIQKGYYDFYLAVPAVIGSVAGGVLGAKYAKYKGNKFIKIMFMIVGGVLGVKLLLGF